MPHATSPLPSRGLAFSPSVIAIRQDERGFGIRFGLTEAEDALLRGPVFETLPEALAWIEAIDRMRQSRG